MNLENVRNSFFSFLSGEEGHRIELNSEFESELDFSDLRKSLIETERFPKYYAVKGNIIVNLGFDLDGKDVESGEHDLIGRYGLFIVRRHSDGHPSFDFELLDENTTSPEAQDKAVTFVENTKNNIMNVRVGIGVAWTFANRPVFKGTIAFFRVARGVEGFTIEEEFDELEKAGTEAQSILFPKNKFSVGQAQTWLKSHDKGSGKVDSPANFHRFRQFDPSRCESTPKTISFGASGIKAVICIKKDQPGAQNVHVDQFIQSANGKKKKKKKSDESVKYAECQCGCLYEGTGPFTALELREIVGKDKAEKMIEKAKLSTQSRNNLPDSAFAFIDSKGVRHFPIFDKAHVRNALARVSQSPFGAKALPKIRAAAKKFGIGEPAKKMEDDFEWSIEKGAKLGAFLRNRRNVLGLSNADLASAAGIAENTVKEILNGSIDRPPDNRLRGFARVLKVPFSKLQSLAGGVIEKFLDTDMFEFDVDIHKADINRGLIYGVVYEPFKRDSHGDHTSPEEIEHAAHNFLPNSITNIDHKDNRPEVEVVESFIAPCDFAYKQNGDGKSMDTEQVVKGAWVLVTKVHDNMLLQSIKNGERTGYSLEGTAQKL